MVYFKQHGPLNRYSHYLSITLAVNVFVLSESSFALRTCLEQSLGESLALSPPPSVCLD